VDFLRTVKRSGDQRTAAWVLPAGRTLRLTTRPAPGAVCLAGPTRLESLRRVLRYATGLRVYGPAVRAGSPAVSSAWEVVLPGMRLTLLLSPEVRRGLSGEGAVLEALSGTEAAEDGEFLALLLGWEPRLDPVDLATRSGLTVERVRAGLTWLGTAGQVGYDTAEASYFHRELPYDTGRVERHNPRLRDARALLAAGGVTLDGDRATVVSGEQSYQVRSTVGRLHCTCPWWAEYGGGRGPCKHALAVRMARRAARASTSSVTSRGPGAGAEAGPGPGPEVAGDTGPGTGSHPGSPPGTHPGTLSGTHARSDAETDGGARAGTHAGVDAEIGAGTLAEEEGR